MHDNKVKPWGAVDTIKWEVPEGGYVPNEHHIHIAVDPAVDDGIVAPAHYMLFEDMEAIEAIRMILTDEEYEGYIRGNILKYRLRAGKKDDTLKDIAKAMQYEKFLGELD